MGTIKDRNGMDRKEAENIKKRWQKYTEEQYKKDLHDPDNHDGVITHLEPDILKCKKVKWLSEEALQIALKSKGEKERYIHLNAEFQRIARRDKKMFLNDQYKEIEENRRNGKD